LKGGKGARDRARIITSLKNRDSASMLAKFQKYVAAAGPRALR